MLLNTLEGNLFPPDADNFVWRQQASPKISTQAPSWKICLLVLCSRPQLETVKADEGIFFTEKKTPWAEHEQRDEARQRLGNYPSSHRPSREKPSPDCHILYTKLCTSCQLDTCVNTCFRYRMPQMVYVQLHYRKICTQSDILDEPYRNSLDVVASDIGLKRVESDIRSEIRLNFINIWYVTRNSVKR
jgi:hypothetical protein